MSTGAGFAIGRFHDRVEMVVTGPWTDRAAEAVRSGAVDRVVLNYAHGFAEPDLEFLRDLPIRQLIILDRRLNSLEPVAALSESLELLHVTSDPSLHLDLAQLPRLVDLSADWHQVRATIPFADKLVRLHLGRYGEHDLMPLARIRDLRRLALTDRPRLRSLSGLANFSELRSLSISMARDLDDIDDLRGRDLIEEIGLESCRRLVRIDALTGCSRLRRLNLSECGDIESLLPLNGLGDLEVLQLFGSTKVLDGDLGPIDALPSLRELRMQSRRHYRPSVAEIQASLPRQDRPVGDARD